MPGRVYDLFLSTIMLLMLCVGNVEAQDDGLKDFNIKVGMKQNTFILTCDKGCAFTELTFQLDEGSAPVWIDEEGMASEKDDGISSDALADFHFSFEWDGEEVRCESTTGTRWEYVTFSCSEQKCNAVLDKAGVSLK